MPKTESKTSRFGMRVSPQTKNAWEATAKAWGYKSTSEWLEAMANWAIKYDEFNNDYSSYMESLKGQ